MGAVEAWADAEILTPDQQQAVVQVGQLVQPALDTLRATTLTTDSAERGAIKARARLRVRDVILDMGVMRVSDALLNGPAARSREHPVYQQVFRGAPAGKITSMKIREEPEVVSRLLDRFDGAPDFEGKTPARDNLAGALQKSYSALDQVDDAETAENAAVDAELGARIAVRGVFEQAYGKLRAAFPGRRDFVESFFPKREASKDDAEPAPGDGAAPEGEKPGGGG